MRTVTLQEFTPSAPLTLTLAERDALRSLVPGLRLDPIAGSTDTYVLTPGSTIGAISLDTLSIEIRPKVGIERVLFLLSYALGNARWQDTAFQFSLSTSLLECLVHVFATHVKRALAGGVLQGYRTEETALAGLRGRIRCAEQVTRRFAAVMPVEVRFDEFTEDILENRLLKAAIVTLARMQMRSTTSYASLRRFAPALENVSQEMFDPKHVPSVTFTRLNERYRPAIEWARLILRHASIESRHGALRGLGVLFDMNAVFEEFVRIALRERLRLSAWQWPSGSTCPSVYLDVASRVRLQPDLSWWDRTGCRFVGDVKYKKVNVVGVKHADLYQLLAYTTATQLPSGLLLYADGEDTAADHHVMLAGKTLHVRCLELGGPITDVESQLDATAALVASLTGSAHAA